METWKLLLGVTGILILFVVVAEIGNVSLSSPAGLGLLVLALVFSGLFYKMTTYGYRIGQQVGEDMQEE